MYLAGSSVRRVEASSRPGWLGSVCHQLLRGKQSGGAAKRIDAYTHFAPLKFLDFAESKGGPRSPAASRELFMRRPALVDVHERLGLLDRNEIEISKRVLAPLGRSSFTGLTPIRGAFFQKRATPHESPMSGTVLTPSNSDLIVALAACYRLPAIYPFAFFAKEGGLISYGFDAADQFRQRGNLC